MIAASAPGKLVLAGEYAVLDGGVALVAAVDRRVVVRQGGGDGTQPPEASATRSCVESSLGAVAGRFAIDTSALRSGDRKLGLGSSAATAAAVAATLAAAHGLDPAAERTRLLAWALEGHAVIAPDGSGIDVAASVHGGYLRCRRGARELVTSPRPASIALRVVWSGRPARTSDMVARVRAFAAADASGYARAIARIAEVATALAQAFERDDATACIERTREHHEALDALGRAADVPIVETSLARIAELAREHGGAAKPSGAGGGDVAVAWFRAGVDLASFDASCRANGAEPLDIVLGADGARREAT